MCSGSDKLLYGKFVSIFLRYQMKPLQNFGRRVSPIIDLCVALGREITKRGRYAR